MARRRFSEMDVLETLIHQGFALRCFRSGVMFTIEDCRQGRIQREHIHELALGGPDEPANCRYSLTSEHAIITNGPPATSAGSSKNRIAKTSGTRAAKFDVNKKPLDEPREPRNWRQRTFTR